MDIEDLYDNNRRWAAEMTARDPDFFARLHGQQSPEFLWIGCADSRVPANQIVDLQPGELFVHRNVANIVLPSDANCMSVLQFAVEVLKVRHVIVCGHYGCGGVAAAMSNTSNGLIDSWLHSLKNVYHKHREDIDALDEEQRVDRLCELNVLEQVANVSQTSTVQRAWLHGQKLTVHGVIYSMRDGILRDLGVRLDRQAQTPQSFQITIE